MPVVGIRTGNRDVLILFKAVRNPTAGITADGVRSGAGNPGGAGNGRFISQKIMPPRIVIAIKDQSFVSLCNCIDYVSTVITGIVENISILICIKIIGIGVTIGRPANTQAATLFKPIADPTATAAGNSIRAGNFKIRIPQGVDGFILYIIIHGEIENLTIIREGIDAVKAVIITDLVNITTISCLENLDEPARHKIVLSSPGPVCPGNGIQTFNSDTTACLFIDQVNTFFEGQDLAVL